MPAAYDIYANELRELRRGQPLYYPEPSLEEGPVEIGDVGYTRQGAFCRLFNASRPADDPSQTLGVPAGYEPLDVGRILRYEAALEPGPLHSKTVFRINADIETPEVVLPASASFRFSCTSSRGAILMLETQMSRDIALHDSRFKNYLLQHCLSWYEFARDQGVQVDFGDIMLITECSKTAAWASAVYSQNSREFGMSFSAGGAFLQSGLDVSVGLERIGPVEYRRSQRRVTVLEYPHNVTKDHTVFVRAYRLGSRSLYLKSIARKIMKSTTRTRTGGYDAQDRGIPRIIQGSEWTTSPTSPSKYPKQNDGYSEVLGSMNVSAVFPEWPDFHPAVALLAHQMENTDVEIAVVHDEDWCSSYSKSVEKVIDEYARSFFDEDFRLRSHHPGESMLSVLQVDQNSISPSDDIGKFQHLRRRRVMDSRSVIVTERASFMLNISTLSLFSPTTVELDPFPFLNKGLGQTNGQLTSQSPGGQNLLHLPAGASVSRNTEKTWVIAILGAEGVGKSALAVRFTQETYTDTYDPTLEAVLTRRIMIDQEYCSVEILDISGQASEKHQETTESMIESAQAFVLVYSIDSRATFKKIKTFYRMILRTKQERPPFILVGSKVDRSQARQVPLEEALQLSNSLGCEYIETSAKTAIGIQDVFINLVQALRYSYPDTHNQADEHSVVSDRSHAPAESKHRHRSSCVLM